MLKTTELLGGYVVGSLSLGLKFHCSRCGEELTDPASVESGIGPWCRKLANKTLAMTIPANLPRAIKTLGEAAMIPGLEEARTLLVEEVTAMVEAGNTDWREVANTVVRLIAYNNGKAVEELAGVLEYLGYRTLAAVAIGAASPTPATVTVANGKLVLKSVKNAAALVAIRKVPGKYFDALTKTWVFPVKELAAVVEIVTKYFPMTVLDTLTLAAECAAVVKTTEVAKIAAPVAKKATVSLVAMKYGVHAYSPYNGAFVAELKTLIGWNDRKWIPAEKCWWVANEKVAVLLSLIEKHYGETPALPAAVAA